MRREGEAMSGYSDAYKDQQTAAFMEHWAPVVETEPTPENLRWNIARARAAEDELAEIKNAIKVLLRAAK